MGGYLAGNVRTTTQGRTLLLPALTEKHGEDMAFYDWLDSQGLCLAKREVVQDPDRVKTRQHTELTPDEAEAALHAYVAHDKAEQWKAFHQLPTWKKFLLGMIDWKPKPLLCQLEITTTTCASTC